MVQHKGGDAVAKGCYWDINNGTQVDVHDKALLPRGRNLAYLRLSPHLVAMASFIAAPVYVISLPIVILAVIAGAAARNIFVTMLGAIPSVPWRQPQDYWLNEEESTIIAEPLDAR